jgi:hypothetical protein
MSKDIFHAREQAEEAVYFQQRDAKLIEKLREKARLSEIAAALAEKLAVDNQELLRRIMQFGITLDTGAAFLLLPLVQIAWAEGKVTDHERSSVLAVAGERGIQPGSADHAQLVKWLEQRPSDALFETALEAIKLGLSVLPPAETRERIERILEACHKVAAVSGGLPKVLHLQSGISAEEQKVLDLIRSRLVGDAPATNT